MRLGKLGSSGKLGLLLFAVGVLVLIGQFAVAYHFANVRNPPPVPDWFNPLFLGAMGSAFLGMIMVVSSK